MKGSSLIATILLLADVHSHSNGYFAHSVTIHVTNFPTSLDHSLLTGRFGRVWRFGLLSHIETPHFMMDSLFNLYEYMLSREKDFGESKVAFHFGTDERPNCPCGSERKERNVSCGELTKTEKCFLGGRKDKILLSGRRG